MIVYYSPLLMPGRKCFPPDELTNICENYLLYKLPINTDIYEYVKTKYNARPCIIQRDNVNKQYILHTELNKDVIYVLVIQSELDNGYYIVIDDENKPYIINDNKHFNSFLISNQIDKNIGYTLFNYIDSVFNIGISKLYTTKTFNEILTLLVDKYGIKYVSFTDNNNNVIIGIIYKGVLLITPTLKFNQMVSQFDNTRINIALDSCKLPPLSMFQERYITKYYVDYKPMAEDQSETDGRRPLFEQSETDGRRPLFEQSETYYVKCIEYKNVDVLIEPTALEKVNGLQSLEKAIVLFDYDAYVKYFKMVSSKKIFIRQFQQLQHHQVIKTIINIYVFIKLTNNINSQGNHHGLPLGVRNKLDKTLTLDDLLTIPTITDNETEIKYVNNTVSWKKSVINKDDFINVYNTSYTNMNNKNIIDIVYNMLYDNMNIYDVNDSIQIVSKIITNNTM